MQLNNELTATAMGSAPLPLAHSRAQRMVGSEARVGQLLIGHGGDRVAALQPLQHWGPLIRVAVRRYDRILKYLLQAMSCNGGKAKEIE